MMQALTHPLPGTRLRWPTPIRKATRWVVRRRWARRLAITAIVWHVIGIIMAITAGPASAADDSNATGAVTNVLGWMGVKDSSGINAADYYLSIDQGGVTHPFKLIWGWLITVEWEAYRACVLCAIWVIKLALSFQWLDLLLTPVRDIANAVTTLTGRVDLQSFMLALAAGAVALWIFRGRFATGLYELVVSLIVAAGVFGILANPVESIAGQDGMLMKTNHMSMEVANGLADDGNTNGDPNQQVDKLTSQLVDTFVRQPTQLMAFGAVLDQKDNKSCSKAFDNAYLSDEDKSTAAKIREKATDIPVVGGLLDDALPGDSSDPSARVRNEVGKCDGGEDLKRYAENPGPEAAIAGFLLIPAGGLIFLYAVYLAGRCVLAAVWAMAQAIKLIPGGILGIAPMFRGQLLRSLSDVAMALMQVAFSIIFTVAYCLVITSLFNNDKSLMATVLVVDFVILIGLWCFRKGLLGLGRWSDRLAEIMSRRPGSSPVTLRPRGGGSSAADTLVKARAARGAYRGAKKIATKVASSRTAQTAAAVGTGGTTAALAKTAQVAATAKTVADTARKSTTDSPSTSPEPISPGVDPNATPSKPTASNPPPSSSPRTGRDAASSSMQSTRARSEALADKLDQARARDQHGNPVQQTQSPPPVASARASAPAAERPQDKRSTRSRVEALAAELDTPQEGAHLRSSGSAPSRPRKAPASAPRTAPPAPVPTPSPQKPAQQASDRPTGARPAEKVPAPKPVQIR